jgi:hypothetical protein
MHDASTRLPRTAPSNPTANSRLTRASSDELPDLPTCVQVAGEGGGCEYATLIFFGVEG